MYDLEKDSLETAKFAALAGHLLLPAQFLDARPALGTGFDAHHGHGVAWLEIAQGGLQRLRFVGGDHVRCVSTRADSLEIERGHLVDAGAATEVAPGLFDDDAVGLFRREATELAQRLVGTIARRADDRRQPAVSLSVAARHRQQVPKSDLVVRIVEDDRRSVEVVDMEPAGIVVSCSAEGL